MLVIETALAACDEVVVICYTNPEFDGCGPFGKVDPALAVLAQQLYAVTLVCAPDFGFVQDGTRQDAAFRQRQHDAYLTALAQRGVRWTLLEGSLNARLVQALGAIWR